MEATFIKLCDKYPGNIKRNGQTVLRWTLVGQAYKRIRDVILGNQLVMAETKIQLVEINQATLTRWYAIVVKQWRDRLTINLMLNSLVFNRYNDRSKQQEKDVLEQGLPPLPSATTSEPLPPAVPLQPSALPVPVNPIPFQFVLPPNTAGQATMRPILPKELQPGPSQPGPSQPCSKEEQSVPYSTKSYRKKKESEELAGEAPRRYRQRTAPSKCSKCGETRSGDHKQYYGNWYCPKVPTKLMNSGGLNLETSTKKSETL